MKTGLFFGTFNPIHVGHMVIAGYLAEFTDLDRVCFVVTPHNPAKGKASLLKEHHRLRLVREAIGDNRRFRVSDVEFKLPQPSYTINTLLHLREQHPPGEQFVLIMGSDNLENFHKWKNHEQILEQFEIYVYPRPGCDGGKYRLHPRVKMTEAPVMEISSSFIRQAVRNKKDVRYMMPEAVYTYIREMHFYEK